MEFHEAAAVLESLRQHRPKLGVGTTRRMLEALGHPEAGVDFVQVAGSNGKGSTARMLERVLREAGLTVGLFTSPPLADFRDQVRVDGRQLTRADVVALVEDLQPSLADLRAEDDAPTHFEALTALAIAHFGRSDVDVAVLEVGIGGRYDATSAIDPVAGAVTTVSLEHTDLLGDTVEEIARDKAQVAPADAPLVTGATGAALEAIRDETDVITVGPGEDADVRAVETGMPSRVESSVSLTAVEWALETNLSLLGQHQAENAGVDPDTVATGLRQATWPGRFEILGTDPTVVLDGAHNPGAVDTLADLLDRFEYEALHLVFGAMADKDHEGMVAGLPPVATAFLTEPANPRAATTADLAAVFENHAETVAEVPSVAEAVERAIRTAGADDFVVVTGSLFAVAEARDRWTRPVVPKDGGRRLAGRAVFAGATFPDATVADVDGRVLGVLLREDQADRVADRLDSIGGQCRRSSTGTPGDAVATVLSGTGTQLRQLARTLQDDGVGPGHGGLGLARVGRELAARLGAERGSAAAGIGSAPGREVSPPPAEDGESRPPNARSAAAGESTTETRGRAIERFASDDTALLGILNVTPDSFYDGGEYRGQEAAIERAREMIAAGADVVDVGGESTRPGADPVPVETEIDRVVPVIQALADRGVPVSVDTRKAAVADAALAAGAEIVNDVSGLGDPEMRFVVADHDAALVLMHSISAPVDPDRLGDYDDVVDDVRTELAELLLHAERAGVDRDQIVVDPGCGFGKRAAESFELVDRIDEFHALGCPVMVGHSRKSMYDRVDADAGDRLPPTLAHTVMAAERGADVVRVHDVAANAAALRTVEATRGE